ncbi:hypothetical protein SULAZ_0867 [Sulfurihydrogenibium azorense Az-Fu1]|uniref:DUF83 domain-containing protein n=1 Tax=Sulfurihydrogenibium azorense (strain DSM 15241 / OCM 825 / Az-Fu1) TaxID=204536 RepID=C1DUQ9_SULAA|nr:hypothetical protein SULAZ_0867 [Sulfurihydrogenibium azorense Az-Fu1]
MFYLKEEKGIEIEGELLIPEEKKRVKIILTKEIEEEIKRAIVNITEILKLPKPPKPEKIQ